MTENTSLSGHLLIAMPAMADPNFDHAVAYICEHNEQGALGLVINRPMNMELGEIFEQLSLPPENEKLASAPVLCGGPVQMERGFVIHDSAEDYESTVEVDDSLYVTTSQDILTALAAGDGPEHALVALGYAGWGAGQLEEEILANAWLSVPASRSILFDTPYEKRWKNAGRILGVDLSQISTAVGHA